MMKRAFLIDTDTASDDAVALIMAMRREDVDVKAITVVAGNVPLEQATRNALCTVELCGRNIPVYAGADRPLVREYENAQWFHGKDGLGDRGFAPRIAQPQAADAITTIIETIHAHPGMTLVTLGPLTNIALALAHDPSIAQKIGRCIVMGGNPCCEGNVTPAAEYNIWVDPEAARRVFHSGLPIEMVGWHLCCGEANLREDDIERVRAINTPLAHFCIDCNAVAMEANRMQSGEVGIALPDPTAMAVAIDPTIATSVSEHDVEIETHSELTRGMTVVDRLNVAHDARNRGVWSVWARREKANAKIIWTIDIPRWKQLLFDLIQ
jgi:purine nucleosidase